MNKFLGNIFNNSRLELAARWILGIVFIYASIHKIINPASFAKIIYGYGLFPDFSINLIAIILPFAELFSGCFLILGIYPRSALLVVNLMLLAFIIAISINLIRGYEFDCGCFSTGQATPAKELLIRDIIYFALGLTAFFNKNSRIFCLKPGFSTPA